MTSPIIFNNPGWGGAIQQAAEPLLAVLKEKAERQQREQQLLIQRGQLALQEEEAKAKRQQEAEARKGREEMAQGLMQEISSLREPGPMAQEITGALKTGDPQLIEAIATKVSRASGIERQQAVRNKYGSMMQQGGGNLSPDQQLAFYQELLAADPNSQSAPAISGVIQSMLAQQRPRAGMTQVVQRLVNGTPHNILVDKTTGADIKDLGDKPPSYADIIERYGTATQQTAGDAFTRFDKAVGEIKRLGANESVRDEVSKAVSIIESAGTTPLNLSALARYTSELAERQEIGPSAQVMLNNVYDMLSTEAFARGGKTLTPTEWAGAIRTLAPMAGEAPESWADKLARMERRTRVLEILSGPAGRNLKKDTGLFPQFNANVPATIPADSTNTIDARLRRARALTGGR